MNKRKLIELTEINITYWEREIAQLQNEKESAEINLKREIKNLKNLKEVK